VSALEKCPLENGPYLIAPSASLDIRLIYRNEIQSNNGQQLALGLTGVYLSREAASTPNETCMNPYPSFVSIRRPANLVKQMLLLVTYMLLENEEVGLRLESMNQLCLYPTSLA
jgi:hypothetical protein